MPDLRQDLLALTARDPTQQAQEPRGLPLPGSIGVLGVSQRPGPRVKPMSSERSWTKATCTEQLAGSAVEYRTRRCDY